MTEEEHTALQVEVDRYRCPEAGCPGGHNVFIGPGKDPHYARIECGVCGHFLAWMAAPKSKTEQKRRRPQIRIPKLDEDCCWLCQRTRLQCAALGLKLQKHHVHDRAARIEAGYPADDPADIDWLCDECHPFVTWRRRSCDRIDAILATQAIIDSVQNTAP